MIEIHPKEIDGPWTQGFTLDEHTLSSDRIGNGESGHPQFETQRSEMGELLYRLKFRNDMSVLETIVDTVADFVRSRGLAPDVVVPVPASKQGRPIQPGLAIAEGVAEQLGVPLAADCVVKVKPTPQLKNVFCRSERRELLKGAYRAGGPDLAGKKVLLIDDLYRSGATLNEVTRTLSADGGADEVTAVALTRTRRLR